MTRTQVAQAVAMLVCAFPSTKWTEENSKVYERMLLDLGYEDLSKAVERLIYTSKFMPTIAEVRAAALEVKSGPVRSPEDAWGDVVTAIRNHGAHRPGLPAFADPVVARCVERMGWRNLCLGTNEAADRARFCELYAALRDQLRKERLAAPGLTPGPSTAALPAPIRNLIAGVGGSR